VLTLLTTAMFLTFALYDQGLLNKRMCLFMGVLFGLLALAPRLASDVVETRDEGWQRELTDPKAHLRRRRMASPAHLPIR
jgi:hypothetical protein